MQNIFPVWKKSVMHFVSNSGKLWLLASLNTWKQGLRTLLGNRIWRSTVFAAALLLVFIPHVHHTKMHALAVNLSFIISSLLMYFLVTAARASLEPKNSFYFVKYMPLLWIFLIAKALYNPWTSTFIITMLFFFFDAPPTPTSFFVAIKRMLVIVFYTLPMMLMLAAACAGLEFGITYLYAYAIPIACNTCPLKISLSFFTYMIILFSVQMLRLLLFSMISCWIIKFKHEHPNLLYV